MLDKLIKKSKERRSNLDSIINESIIEISAPLMKNFDESMAYYRCAIMEVETKLNVLNEEFSLQHDRNPINSIQSKGTSHSINRMADASGGVRERPGRK